MRVESLRVPCKRSRAVSLWIRCAVPTLIPVSFFCIVQNNTAGCNVFCPTGKKLKKEVEETLKIHSKAGEKLHFIRQAYFILNFCLQTLEITRLQSKVRSRFPSLIFPQLETFKRAAAQFNLIDITVNSL